MIRSASPERLPHVGSAGARERSAAVGRHPLRGDDAVRGEDRVDRRAIRRARSVIEQVLVRRHPQRRREARDDLADRGRVPRPPSRTAPFGTCTPRNHRSLPSAASV
jgi:hypothetical protein